MRSFTQSDWEQWPVAEQILIGEEFVDPLYGFTKVRNAGFDCKMIIAQNINADNPERCCQMNLFIEGVGEYCKTYDTLEAAKEEMVELEQGFDGNELIEREFFKIEDSHYGQ